MHTDGDAGQIYRRLREYSAGQNFITIGVHLRASVVSKMQVSKVIMQITPTLTVNEAAIEETFMRSSGPGGQNVNKVETGVQLRFDISRSGLPVEIQLRLLRRADKRLTNEGVLVLNAQSFRTREANRRDARERLAGIIRQSTQKPKRRRPTQISKAAHERRLQAKRQRGEVKKQRRLSFGEG